MRRAYHNVSFIVEGDNFYGVSLGWDFTSEHEWGIRVIKNKFGLKSDKTNVLGIKKPLLGIDNRRMTIGEVLFKEDKDLCVLTSERPYGLKEKYKAKDILGYDIKNVYNDLECAWDDGDFCIASKNKEDFPKMRELYEAFKNKNIAITFLKSEVPAFSNSSLSVLILDKLPQDVLDEMYNVDKEAYDLIEYEKKIGVTKLKEETRSKSGYRGEKYFMACSPRWIDYKDAVAREEKKRKGNTEYDIMFWVNYSDDDDNYGWYTAEEIIKWLSTPGLKLKSLNVEREVNINH